MLFLPPGASTDGAWEKITRATADGRLGCSAKIAPCEGQVANVVCCVYVQDCTNKSEVQRVLQTLQNDLGFRIKCGFKPDFYTHLGKYQNNKWRLKPTLYSVAETLSWTTTSDEKKRNFGKGEATSSTSTVSRIDTAMVSSNETTKSDSRYLWDGTSFDAGH
uniref:Uncharacterized protein n=2 Tax=Corethron hystrix TaxID=216773 RepID=A0A7S1FSB7_9STRA|mmetsp:Transcript_25037/g.57863  ORF Transcript_25037/g.57863 Transcript_25037/m.57863 type:complete len:162 (+) Transcript_25037:241-726(+)